MRTRFQQCNSERNTRTLAAAFLRELRFSATFLAVCKWKQHEGVREETSHKLECNNKRVRYKRDTVPASLPNFSIKYILQVSADAATIAATQGEDNKIKVRNISYLLGGSLSCVLGGHFDRV